MIKHLILNAVVFASDGETVEFYRELKRGDFFAANSHWFEVLSSGPIANPRKTNAVVCLYVRKLGLIQ